jgi:hypothetical protein
VKNTVQLQLRLAAAGCSGGWLQTWLDKESRFLNQNGRPADFPETRQATDIKSPAI